MDSSRMADMGAFDKAVIRAMVSGVSDAVVPLSVINTQEGLLGVYDLTGLSDISRMELCAGPVLDICGRILEALDSLKDILIFPEDIALNEKVIFRDDVTGKVRICVIASQTKRTEKDNVSGLLERMKAMTDERGGEYLEILKREYL